MCEPLCIRAYCSQSAGRPLLATSLWDRTKLSFKKKHGLGPALAWFPAPQPLPPAPLQELRLALGVGVQPEELGVAQLPGVHWQELGVARRSKNPKLSP